jgi:hypothetical protein
MHGEIPLGYKEFWKNFNVPGTEFHKEGWAMQNLGSSRYSFNMILTETDHDP